MSSISREVFLLVTIPTHLRVLMDGADLLQSSGRYVPVLVYYPSAVFDQNHANCQLSPHKAFIWNGSRFIPKAEYLSGDWRSGSHLFSVVGSSLSRWLPNRGIYRRLLNFLPFLPTPANLVFGVRRVVSKGVAVVRFAAGTYGLVRSALFGLIAAAKSLFMRDERHRAFVNRNWLQRSLLHVFASEWNSATKQGSQSDLGFRQRLFRLVSDGMFSGLSGQRRLFEEISELIQCQRPVLIILPEANIFYDSQFVIRAAHLASVRVVILPFTIVNTLEWAEAFFDIPIYNADRGWNRLFARAFPRWVLEHKGRRLILPFAHILGCEYFDMVPAIPWLINSGNADAIAAESYFMSDYYLNAGIEKDKVRFTGALSDDKLFALLNERDVHRTALGERFGVPIRERIFLIGLPPDQFGGGKRQGCEFDSYKELIRFMVGMVASLSGSKVTVLVNLHPRVKLADVVWLSALGATIIDEPIERLVPLVDVYIAVASATIRLGISSGIPVVNYDAYQYDYDDYKGLLGVCEVKSMRDYESVLSALINDHYFYSKIHAAQKETASSLCLVDGKAGERLLSLFSSLIQPAEST